MMNEYSIRFKLVSNEAQCNNPRYDSRCKISKSQQIITITKQTLTSLSKSPLNRFHLPKQIRKGPNHELDTSGRIKGIRKALNVFNEFDFGNFPTGHTIRYGLDGEGCLFSFFFE